MQKMFLKHYAQRSEKKQYFPRLYLIFQKWTFINVQNSFPFFTFGIFFHLFYFMDKREQKNIFLYVKYRKNN
jgi:hypothetical protein